MVKFKAHDAGCIWSLGCNCCLRSSYSLQFLQRRSLFLLWIDYTLSLWCAASISVVCFSSTCFFAKKTKPRDVNLIGSEMVARGKVRKCLRFRFEFFDLPSIFLNLRLHFPNLTFWRLWPYRHWQCHFNSFHVFFTLRLLEVTQSADTEAFLCGKTLGYESVTIAHFESVLFTPFWWLWMNFSLKPDVFFFHMGMGQN